MDWVSPADSLVSTCCLSEYDRISLVPQVLIGCADNKIKMFDVNSQMCLWDVNAEKNSKYIHKHYSFYSDH